jgi:outer membrane protein assembly factor BamB
VWAWSATTDKALWAQPITTSYMSGLAVAGGQLLVTTGDETTPSVIAYSLDTGTESWEYTPSDGTVITGWAVASGSADPSGAKAGIGDEFDELAGAPGGTDKPAFIAVDKHAVVWLDATSGAPIARVTLPATASKPFPLVTATGVMLVAGGSLIEAVPAGGGRVAWSAPVPAGFTVPGLATTGGQVFLESRGRGAERSLTADSYLSFDKVAELNQ